MMNDTYAVRETAQTNEIRENIKEIEPIAQYLGEIHSLIAETYALLADVYTNYVGDRAKPIEPASGCGNSMSESLEFTCDVARCAHETACRLASIFGRAREGNK